tara:strand:- start:95 stop:556 length:462 start_codon:yes stop_codon:yes gene_type:complete
MKHLLIAPLILALYGPVAEVKASSSHELCLQQSSTYSDPDDYKVIYQDCMFDASGKINPEKEARELQSLAYLKLKQKDYLGAHSAITKTISLQPNNLDLYSTRSIVRWHLKDFEGSKSDNTGSNINHNINLILNKITGPIDLQGFISHINSEL